MHQEWQNRLPHHHITQHNCHLTITTTTRMRMTSRRRTKRRMRRTTTMRRRMRTATATARTVKARNASASQVFGMFFSHSFFYKFTNDFLQINYNYNYRYNKHSRYDNWTTRLSDNEMGRTMRWGQIRDGDGYDGTMNG